MAEEFQIAGTDATAKVRNPLGVVGLSLITIGIYFFFWWYFINREMRDLGKARGVDLGESPGNSVLAVTLGALIIVPASSRSGDAAASRAAQETVGLELARQRADHLHPAPADRPSRPWYARAS